jgi:quercetin dioxygenase-like cupin family protein
MHESIYVGDAVVTFLKTRQETGNTVEMYELTLPQSGSTVMPHVHREEDLTVLGMNGISTWTVNGEVIELRPGQSLTIPRGTPHSCTNLHETITRMICMQTPGSMGPEFFREIAQHLNELKPDIAAISEVMNRYGITPI